MFHKDHLYRVELERAGVGVDAGLDDVAGVGEGHGVAADELARARERERTRDAAGRAGGIAPRERPPRTSIRAGIGGGLDEGARARRRRGDGAERADVAVAGGCRHECSRGRGEIRPSGGEEMSRNISQFSRKPKKVGKSLDTARGVFKI